ncbi:glutathione S-transferase, N-terminal domain protein [Bordetella pertussis STO1-CHOC-0018]|nr:glutathione S-transferase, N-terminal domain protein [Bordetella pertussis STO1-CHOC-0018]
MPAPLTLYVDARFRSPYAMSAHVALAEKQLEFEVRLVDLAAGEQRMQPYQSRALTARVPALAHAGFHLTESSAIQEYLEDAFAPPAHPALYPAGAQARARARQVQAWLRTDLAALRRARPIDSVFDAPATTPLDDAAPLRRRQADPRGRGAAAARPGAPVRGLEHRRHRTGPDAQPPGP